MLPYIVDLSDAPARLRVDLQRLVIERPEQPSVTVPLAEVGVVVAGHPQLSLTRAVLSGLAAAGGVWVTCDEQRLPVGMQLPLAAHFLQAERFAAQARCKAPLKKRLWRQLVRAKIRAQAELLVELHGDDEGLAALIPLVRSGDPANVEARAARRYWQRLFGSNSFARERDAQDQNRLLNYGYTVLRAMVARSLCAAGLHPSLGLHHHNRYSAFCLADDVMEPFRALVDRAVAEHVAEFGAEAEFGRGAKEHLLRSLQGRTLLRGEQRTVFDALTRAATSLAEVFDGERTRLELPERWFHAAA